MSQYQSQQRFAALSSQHRLKFSQRIRDKENTDDAMTRDDLFEFFAKYVHSKYQNDTDDSEFNTDFHISDFDSDQEPSLVENIPLNLDHMGVFCFKHLSTCTLDQMISKQMFASIAAFMQQNLRKLMHNHLCSESSGLETTVCEFFSCADALVDFVTQNLTQATAKFEAYGDFFLAIVGFTWSYLKYLRYHKHVESPDSYNERQQELNVLINSILIKLASLLETKLNDLTEARNETSLLALSSLQLNIIDYYKESKCVVFLWKVLAKLTCKNRLLQRNANINLTNSQTWVILKNLNFN